MDTTTDPDLAPLFDLLRRFDKVQDDLANFGAGDTEPDGVWQSILWGAMEGEPYPDISSARNWQLYSRMAGVDGAAARMTACAKLAHVCIVRWRDELPARQWRKIEKYIVDFCWRM